MAATCSRSHARAEETLGGGDPPFEVFSRARHTASHAASRCGLHRIAYAADIMGWHEFPLWLSPWPTSSGVRTTLWNLPSTTGWGDQHVWCLEWMARAQPVHSEPASSRQGWWVPSATIVGGCGQWVLHVTIEEARLPEAHWQQGAQVNSTLCDHPKLGQATSDRQWWHWRAISLIIRCQQAHFVQSLAPCTTYSSGNASLDGGRDFRLPGTRCLGDRTGRSAFSIQVLPYGNAGKFGVRGGLVPSRMANPCIPSLCWIAFWASASSHIFQQIFQTVGGASQAFLQSFDIPLFWWCNHHRSAVV